PSITKEGKISNIVPMVSHIIIYGLYLDIKEKNKMEKRIKEKVNNKYRTKILLEIDEDEKYMLKNLTYDYGYNSIEEFIVNILNEEIIKE
uniref:hypothetical protein n=1 Tax=uncultured Clostridium sp. TaxID=59620 RepID=UPI00272B3D0A